jgi:hypothetical protein
VKYPAALGRQSKAASLCRTRSYRSGLHRALTVQVAVHARMAASETCASMVDPCKLDSSLSLLKSPALSAAFALYVEKALCYESYKFCWMLLLMLKQCILALLNRYA